MLRPFKNTPSDLLETPLPPLLEEVFFAPLREVMENGLKTRSCKVLKDLPFVAMSVLRVLQSSRSGRDFIQSHGIPSLPELNVANYFGSLGSKRRLALITATHHAMTARHRPGLRAHHDLPASLPELDGWEVWAGDGHAIAHATHDPRNDKGAYSPVHAIYNLAPLTVIPRPIERTNSANAMVIADETVYFNNTPGVWRRITATCPDSDELYVTLTNEMTLPPGVLNQVRRLRWNIEKIFNQHERKLEESKAWAANDTGKRIQATAICIAHNLLRLFSAKLEREEGIVDTKVIRAWHQRLAGRAKAAATAGRELPLKLYLALYRPTEVSLQFIRWLRSMLLRATCYRESLTLLRPLMAKHI
jgi:hypothetical protein